MTTKAATLGQPNADRVHSIIRQHMIGDGFPIVFDYERSHGSWISDAESGDEFSRFLQLLCESAAWLQPSGNSAR